MRSTGLMLVAMLLVGSVAHAAPIVYTASLSGAASDPPTASTGSGSATVTLDTGANTMRVEIDFSGLTGTTTAAHIHCCTASPGSGNAGLATQTPTLLGFPFGVTSGTYDETFDLTLASTFSAAFISTYGSGTAAGATDALAQGLAEGRAYVNIHTTTYSAGEIRGYLGEAAVPEPGTLALLGIGVAGLATRRLRRRP